MCFLMNLLGSVIEAEIFHIVDLDRLQFLAVQQPVAERHSTDKLPTGHHPHHRVITADLHVSCSGGKKTSITGRKFKQEVLMTWKDGERCVLTGSSEGDAEVCDWQQLRCVDAISSQQLHKITCFYTTRPGPLWKNMASSEPGVVTVHWLRRISAGVITLLNIVKLKIMSLCLHSVAKCKVASCRWNTVKSVKEELVDWVDKVCEFSILFDVFVATP